MMAAGKSMIEAAAMMACASASAVEAIQLSSGSPESVQPAAEYQSGRESIYTPDSKCGFGQAHTEMLNMPALGTMLFVGLRWDR